MVKEFSKYSVHVPSCGLYALDFYARSERDARNEARNFLKVNRLPNGSSVWKAN